MHEDLSPSLDINTVKRGTETTSITSCKTTLDSSVRTQRISERRVTPFLRPLLGSSQLANQSCSSLFVSTLCFVCYAVAGGLFSHSFSSIASSLPHPELAGPMSRWLFPWSGSIKKRACRYLLQHYLGHFFQERLSLEQLSLDLYNGSGVIKEINIDVWVSQSKQ